MVGKKILLTMNHEMHAVIRQKARSSFMTVQEFIADTLRKRILMPAPKKTKSGKASKSDEKFLEYFSRER